VTHSIKKSDGADHDEFMIDHQPVDPGQTADQHRDSDVGQADPSHPMAIVGG
jgi:hypothetical protein